MTVEKNLYFYFVETLPKVLSDICGPTLKKSWGCFSILGICVRFYHNNWSSATSVEPQKMAIWMTLVHF